MIAFKYTKTDGAEYMSHLDVLRHIDRTLRRAGIAVEYSRGFNKHPRIFMGAPLALGVRSAAEFCTVETEFCGNFREAFNACSPAGIKCIDYKITQNNPNYAESIKSCRYEAEGSFPFECADVMNMQSIVITDKRGRETDIRPRILALEGGRDKLAFTLSCGESNLRPDLFCEWLQGMYGAQTRIITKTESIGEGTF